MAIFYHILKSGDNITCTPGAVGVPFWYMGKKIGTVAMALIMLSPFILLGVLFIMFPWLLGIFLIYWLFR
jgi:hypothetical protein